MLLVSLCIIMKFMFCSSLVLIGEVCSVVLWVCIGCRLVYRFSVLWIVSRFCFGCILVFGLDYFGLFMVFSSIVLVVW